MYKRTIDPAEAIQHHMDHEPEMPDIRTDQGWVDLPDLIQSVRHEAWAEGFEAGYRAFVADSADGPAIPDNPYPMDRCSPDIRYHSSPHVGCILR
jgi:hypothetical protein